MELKKTIKSNEELYGDYELIPLNLDAVQQRIDFFNERVGDALDNESYSSDSLSRYHKAWVFWKEIRENHCERD